MKNAAPLFVLAVVLGCASAEKAPPPKSPEPAPAAPVKPSPEEDLAAARAIFEANIKAIQEKDKEAYIATYRADPRLVRAGADGISLGYEDFAKGVSPTGSEDWPEKLIAEKMEVHWIRPGVVYGSYHYTVTIKGVTTQGVSERVFIEVEGQWRIAVTTAFETPAKAPEKKADPKPTEG
jgi:hypothetical protein